MRSSFNSYGSVAVWFHTEVNSGVFDSGENFIWKKFELSGKECSLISEGNKVSAVLELGSNKEKTIISTIVQKSKTADLHSLILKWTDNMISLYIDNKHLNEVKIMQGGNFRT
ncbi:MAG: hypothetical protein PF574_05325 [Candidatus Delongbacteria bacterium]|jgi:hypothetical protein|nr:hypothetical protein [Candidatus Delongbacteria bacterium]